MTNDILVSDRNCLYWHHFFKAILRNMQLTLFFRQRMNKLSVVFLSFLLTPIIQQPYWFMFDKGAITAMHGSPCRYGLYAIYFCRLGNTQPQTINCLVYLVNVAHVIATFLDMTAFSAAQLVEVFESQQR